MKSLLLLSLLIPAACSGVDAAAPVRNERAALRLDQLLAGKVAGETRSCIRRRDAERQEIIDDRTVIYRISRDRLIRGDLSPACTGLDRNSTMIRRSTSLDICRGEIFEVRDAGTGFQQGSCIYGDFTEYRAARR